MKGIETSFSRTKLTAKLTVNMVAKGEHQRTRANRNSL